MNMGACHVRFMAGHNSPWPFIMVFHYRSWPARGAWLSTALNGRPPPAAAHGSPWPCHGLFMAGHGPTWPFTTVHGRLGAGMVVTALHGRLWMVKANHGHSWPSRVHVSPIMASHCSSWPVTAVHDWPVPANCRPRPLTAVHGRMSGNGQPMTFMRSNANSWPADQPKPTFD